MDALTERIEAEALNLPAPSRARLVELLVASLAEEADVEKSWAEEIRRRVDELRSGAVEPIQGEQVFEELKSLYR